MVQQGDQRGRKLSALRALAEAVDGRQRVVRIAGQRQKRPFEQRLIVGQMAFHQCFVTDGGRGIQVSLGQVIGLDSIAAGHGLVVDEIGTDGKQQQNAVCAVDGKAVFSCGGRRPAIRDHPHADLELDARAALRVLPVDPPAAVVGWACAVEDQIAAVHGELSALHLRFEHGRDGATAGLTGRQTDCHDLLRMRDKRLPHERNIVLRVADRRHGAFQIQFAVVLRRFGVVRETQDERSGEHVGLAVIRQQLLLDEPVRLDRLAGGDQFTGLADRLRTVVGELVFRHARPQRVFVQIETVFLHAAEMHGPKPSVAQRHGGLPISGRRRVMQFKASETRFFHVNAPCLGGWLKNHTPIQYCIFENLKLLNQ